MMKITKRDNDPNSSDERRITPSSMTPFSIINRFDQMLEDALQAQVSFPKVDVTENDKEIKIIANIPGMDPKKVDIEVGDDYVLLSGHLEKEDTEKDAKGRVYRYEREYGEFRREFALPARIKRDGVVAKAKNGTLKITLPKAEEGMDNKNRIEIKEE